MRILSIYVLFLVLNIITDKTALKWRYFNQQSLHKQHMLTIFSTILFDN